MSVKRFYTTREWKIDKSRIEDMAIIIQDDGIEIKYDIPMEEAMAVIAVIKKDVRHNPNCEYFEVAFGGKKHPFSRVGILKFCDDLKAVVNECLAIRIFGTRTYASSVATAVATQSDDDLNYLKLPTSTGPSEAEIAEDLSIGDVPPPDPSTAKRKGKKK
jgi:hypothetical protein